MSSPATPATPDSTQQTLHDVTISQRLRSFPSRIILRYEPTEIFEEFLVGNFHIKYVVFNATDAAKLVRDHGSVHAVLEDWQIPIVTATDPDADIYNRQRDDIRELLANIQPAIYIPDAGTVYWDEPDSQEGGLRFFIRRLEWVIDEVEKNNWNIAVLPLAKGMEKWHYEILRDCYERHDFSNYAFYCKQYFGEDRGNRISQLESHIQNLIDVMNAKKILVIALLSENYLRRLQPQVQAACGIYQFAANCKEDGQFIEVDFVDWRDNLENTLSDKPTVIQQ
jgi:hypothetical protein